MEAGSSEISAMSVNEWNRQIDSFDVDGLARQLERIGAGYFFITIGQNTGFYLSPNETYDSIVRRRPSRCSRRDLVADLWEALSARSIKLLVYLPCNAPIFDLLAKERLMFAPAWKDRDPRWFRLKFGDVKPLPGIDSRFSQFQRHWEAIITEWSLRWGKKVSGWWLDGCYHADLMYNFPDEPNWGSLIRALKAGNSNSIVAFNPGGPQKSPVRSATKYEDYTAGHDPCVSLNICPGRWLNGIQWHALCFMGERWGGGRPRFCIELLIGYTKDIIMKGGVVTWDVPIRKNGLLPDKFMAQLEALGEAL